MPFDILPSLMNSTQSTNLQPNKELRSTYNEDDHLITWWRRKGDKLKRRLKWMRQQEFEIQHIKLKQQMITNYEKKRVEATKFKQTSSRHSRSKSRSKSPLYHQHKERSSWDASKSDTHKIKKLDGSTNEAVPLFKGPEGIQISTAELRRIKVDICRNIFSKGQVTELQRDILNPEDVIVKRRDGEGSKPIFDRDEIKNVVDKMDERRTVVVIDGEQSTGKIRISRRRSLSLSPIRNRSYSPGYLSSYRTTYRSAESKDHDKRIEYTDYHASDSHYIYTDTNNTQKHKDYKEKYMDRNVKRHNTRSSSKERDTRSSYSSRYRDRSNERSRERKDRDRDRDRDRERDRNRDRSRDRRNPAPHYVEHVPVPIYYGNFPPRPYMVSPMVTIPRGQVPPLGRGRHPPLMGLVRPFPPQFVPPDMYRMRPSGPNSN